MRVDEEESADGHYQFDGRVPIACRRRRRYREWTRLDEVVHFGQPHLYGRQAAQLVDLAVFDRVKGSLHTLAVGNDRYEPNTLFRMWPAEDVMWADLEEIPRMVVGSAEFEVLCHIDYAVRAWPSAAVGPFDPRRFEEGFRGAMRTLAQAGRVLEMNTRRLWPWIPRVVVRGRRPGYFVRQ